MPFTFQASNALFIYTFLCKEGCSGGLELWNSPKLNILRPNFDKKSGQSA